MASTTEPDPAAEAERRRRAEALRHNWRQPAVWWLMATLVANPVVVLFALVWSVALPAFLMAGLIHPVDRPWAIGMLTACVLALVTGAWGCWRLMRALDVRSGPRFRAGLAAGTFAAAMTGVAIVVPGWALRTAGIDLTVGLWRAGLLCLAVAVSNGALFVVASPALARLWPLVPPTDLEP